MKELLYRVENEKMYGCYTYIKGNSPVIHNLTVEYRDDPEFKRRQPDPVNDGLNVSEYTRPSFGFKSIEQLKKWFTWEELSYIHAHGFDVYLVWGNVLEESNRQVFFKRITPKTRFKVPWRYINEIRDSFA